MNLIFPISFSVPQLFTVFARLGGILMTAPLFGSVSIRPRFRVALVLAITAAIVPVLPSTWAPGEFQRHLTLSGLFLLISSELMFGFTAMLAVRLVLECAMVGGLFIDRNMGFAMARTVDPGGDHQGTVMAVLFSQIMLMLFLTMDGHHDLIRIAVYSFRHVAPGSFVLSHGILDEMTSCGSKMLADGFRTAFPLFAMILFVNIAMAFMARFGQEFNVLMLSFPIRIGSGLLVLTMVVPVVVHLYRDRIGAALDIMGSLSGL